MSDEQADAIALANKLLDQHWADPDDDLRMLSRQLLRAHERIASRDSLLREALHEMCHTVAPRNSFTDCVDKIDALVGSPPTSASEPK